MLLERQVSGMVFAGGQYAEADAPHEHYARLLKLRLPVVLVNAAAEHLDFPTRLDGRRRRDGAGLRPPRLAGPRADRADSRARPTTFRRAASSRRSRPSPGCRPEARSRAELVERTMFSLEGGHAAATRLIGRGATGIVCASDPLALGAIRAARRAGLSVPADISVVGYDDSAFMNCTDPPLTTVRQPIEAIGRAAVAMLIGQIEGSAVSAGELFFEPEIVARGSTAAAARQSAPVYPCVGARGDAVRPIRRALLRQISRKPADLVKILHLIVRCAFSPREVNTRGYGDAQPHARPRSREPVADAPLVARRGRLPGLRPELRGRERRRDRRSRRCARAAAVPPRPRRRRPLVQPLVPVADGGHGLRRRRTTGRSIRHFGTLEQAEQLIAEARALGIRTIVDIVPNHVSDQHPWFVEALASPPGSPERGALLVPARSGRRRRAAAERLAVDLRRLRVDAHGRRDGAPGEWYLHLFAPEQPDLNWEHPDVWFEHEDVLRFWFDRGVAGVRIDSAALLVKDPALPEETPDGEQPVHGP